jgi:hypothetical protein
MASRRAGGDGAPGGGRLSLDWPGGRGGGASAGVSLASGPAPHRTPGKRRGRPKFIFEPRAPVLTVWPGRWVAGCAPVCGQRNTPRSARAITTGRPATHPPPANQELAGHWGKGPHHSSLRPRNGIRISVSPRRLWTTRLELDEADRGELSAPGAGSAEAGRGPTPGGGNSAPYSADGLAFPGRLELRDLGLTNLGLGRPTRLSWRVWLGPLAVGAGCAGSQTGELEV